jgi:two-component system, sensor histidine kinase YesM
LKHYMHIMQIRYGNAFEVEWDVDEKAESLFILKLLLQPLLENCIVHGLTDLNKLGKIAIRTRFEGDIAKIEIADNGVGMTEEQLGMLLSAADVDRSGTFSGMGVSNVHKRIQLHYGPEYGLRIEPNEPSGTIVIVTIPAIRQIRGNHSA